MAVDNDELSRQMLSTRVRAVLKEREAGPSRLDALFTDEAYFRRTPTDIASMVADFMFGNPTSTVSARFTELVAAAADPKGDVSYFAYTRQLESCARWLLTDFLPSEFGFDPAVLHAAYTSLLPQPEQSAEQKTRNLFYGGAGGVIVTNGAFAGLLVSLQVLCNPGDEVIYLAPSWFFYRAHIIECDAVPVCIHLQHTDDFDLPLDAIAAAITPRTKVLLLNSPHNPSGAIYSQEALQRLADLLAPHGIWVIHDAAYQQVRFTDSGPPPSMPLIYPRSLLVYTWGKILLAPAQRIGFVLASPLLSQPEKDVLIPALSVMTTMSFSHANRIMQEAIPALSRECQIDLVELKLKRNLICGELSRIGYRVFVPQGTFYILAAHPSVSEASGVVALLAANGVYVLDGRYCEIPSHFRISITATLEMCRASIPVFEQVFNKLIAS